MFPTGADDDYYIYSGRMDPRIKAIPHDLDTILGLGDGSSVSDPEFTIYDMIEREMSFRHWCLSSGTRGLRKYHQELRNLLAAFCQRQLR